MLQNNFGFQKLSLVSTNYNSNNSTNIWTQNQTSIINQITFCEIKNISKQSTQFRMDAREKKAI